MWAKESDGFSSSAITLQYLYHPPYAPILQSYFHAPRMIPPRQPLLNNPLDRPPRPLILLQRDAYPRSSDEKAVGCRLPAWWVVRCR
jgi:hypothetical protein